MRCVTVSSLVFKGLSFLISTSLLIVAAQECEQTPVETVILLDITPENATLFQSQQLRLVETLRHLNSTLRNRKHSFSFIAFHRAPVLLTQLNAQNATVDRVIDQIKSLRPRRRLETSPAKALDLAAEEITTNGDVGAKAIILLAHEGLNTDLIAETLEATAKLAQLKASVFAVTGSEQPNLSSLIGYTGERSHVYAHSDDNAAFLSAVDAAVGRCFDNSKQSDLPVAAPSFNGLIESKTLVKETSVASSSNETVKRSCSTNKVDLMIVLDTSGSVFHSFAQERQIAIDLVNAVDPSNATDALRVAVVRFAAEPTVVLSLASGRSKEEIAGQITQIQFTGKNTRIADAVELALQQLEDSKRHDATQVFVLISDGHGQEFWSKAQAAGKRLQSSGAEIFSVTANADYNLAELALYAGDEHRVYVGPAHATFVPTIASFVRGCLGLDEAKTQVAFEPASTTRTASDAITTEAAPVLTNATLVESTTFLESRQEEKSQVGNSSTPLLLDNTPTETSSLSVDQNPSELTVRDQKLDDDAAKFLLEKIAKNRTSDAEDTSEEDALKAAARKEQMEQFLREQKVTPGPANCDTDLFFLVDRAKSSRFDFGQQLELASDLVEKVLDQDLTAGKVRLSIVAFAEAAHKRLSLTKTSTKHDFRAALADVKPTLKATSLANGIEALLKASSSGISFNNEIEENRRNESRAIVILITDGRPKNKEDDIKALSTKLLSIPKSEVFAVSLNMVHNIERLQQLTGNKWRVFVDARVRQFIERVGTSILECSIPPEDFKNITAAGEIGKHAPKSAIERIEHLQAAAKEVQKPSDCDGDPVDLMIVLDVSTSITKEFDEQKQVAVDLLKQTPAEDYPKRVRAGLITFNQYVEKTVSLNNSLAQSDLLFTLARVEHSGGQTSVVSGVHAALDELNKFHRPEARVVIVIISDGNSRDVWSKVLKAGNSLRMTSADVYAVSLSREYHLEELTAYTGSESRVFDDRRVPRFLLDARRAVFGCRDEITKVAGENATRQPFADSVVPAREDTSGDLLTNETKVFKKQEDEKSVDISTSLDSGSDEAASTAANSTTGEESLKSVEINATSVAEAATSTTIETPSSSTKDQTPQVDSFTATAATPPKTDNSSETTAPWSPTVHFDLNADHPSVSLTNSECKVDLLFIVDTSQSVSDEFQRQLQFSVDLVKRLPDDDFENRVRVATVSFHKTAKVQFPFGTLKEKSAVLDSLFNIEHTAGSTSLVSGVLLGIDEALRGRRPDARLMIVIISDGNSQDPWGKVVDAASRLRSIGADVYAVTVSHDYFFRELELYAGNKWFVYIDARIRQFLDEAEMSLVECRSPSIPASSRDAGNSTAATPQSDTATTSTPAGTSEAVASVTVATSEAEENSAQNRSSSSSACQQDIVDLMFILDTSTSIEKEFYAEKNFALDLIKVLPESDFSNRIAIALSRFNSDAALHIAFASGRSRNDILYDVERVMHTGGQTSLVSGTEVALKEIASHRRPGSRLVTVIISDGNSQDDWPKVQETAKKLRETGSEIYAVTLSEKYYFDELKEYTGNEQHVYTDEHVGKFIQEVGQSVVSCAGSFVDRVTMVPSVEASPTPTTTESSIISTQLPAELNKTEGDKGSTVETEFVRDPGPIRLVGIEDIEPRKPVKPKKCRYSKMDLIIILDASTSRENVFEHQRELALSLIERLPVSKDDTHVATGVNSFTNVPTLRQTLGLGRERNMVRHAIEGIDYHGGSTLTAKAVELAVDDLERGKRADAIQVVVLMNDGMSQDPWEDVLKASDRLGATGAERFGVALGQEVDLRELRHYIGNDDRIYRDGSTERFLSDVESLLNGEGKDCPPEEESGEVDDKGFEFQIDDACEKPKLDVVVLFDNSDNTPNLTDPKINSNRFLLLDVLGSLPLDGDTVNVALFSFADDPVLEHKFSNDQDRTTVFKRIESIKPRAGQPSYAAAVREGLTYYSDHKRSDARGLFLVVGDGHSTDRSEDRSLASNAIRKTTGLTCHAVDSGKDVNIQTLAAYTGSRQRVYNYDRNAEFAKIIHMLATAGEKCGVKKPTDELPPAAAPLDDEERYSTPEPHRQKDIAQSAAEKGDKNVFGDGEKVLIRAQTKFTTARTTPTTEATQPSSTVASSTAASSTRPTRTTNKTSRRTSVGRSTVSISATTPRTAVSRNRTTFGGRTTPSARTTSPVSLTTRRIRPLSQRLPVTASTSAVPETTTSFIPGCLIDLLLIMDSSGSVEETFQREKELAAGIIESLRVGPDNARVALIKFAAPEKVRTIYSFGHPQVKQRLMRALHDIPFSSGTTAIHSALTQAIAEYSPLKGARPGRASPIAIVFTDGFSQKDTAEAAELLRRVVPELYAVAINHQFPISRSELERITGDPRRVFTDANIRELHSLLARHFRSC